MLERPGPLAGMLGVGVQRAGSEGSDSAEVARLTFAAIEARRFYSLTHGHSKSGVKARLEDILGDRVPTLVRL